MGKHGQKHSALNGNADTNVATKTTTKLQRAPDPFPIFKRTGTPDDLNELDCNIEGFAEQLIADLRRAQRTTAGAKSPKLRPTLKPPRWP